MPKSNGSPDNGATKTTAPILEQASAENVCPNTVGIQVGDTADAGRLLDRLELPNYITPLPKDIDRHTLHFLQQKGAFAVPEKGVVDELFRAFICYAYPSLPVVELGNFLDIKNGISGKNMSLLLFQTVMMAGATFAQISLLQRAGFQSHEDAQKILFKRAKLLYEMEVESSPITIIQALLLMTSWYGRLNDTKGRLYWLGIALSFATGIGLDKPHHYSHEPDQQQFHRRLWACCITRNHLLSLTERRKIPVQVVDRDLEFLRPGDLDEMTLAQALDQYDVYDCELKAKVVGHLFKQQLKLCVIIQHSFESLYELSGLKQGSLSDSFMVLMTKSKATGVQMLARDQELREWYKETSSLKESALGHDHRRNGPVMCLHTATLEMLYLTVLSVAHSPHLLYDQAANSATEALQGFSSITLRSAARRITDVGRAIDECEMVHLLPSIVIEAFVVASVQHLKDVMTTESDLRSTGSLYLRQTLQMLSILKTKYKSADSAIGFIERLKSGELFHRTVELEDRMYLLTRWGDNFVSYHTGEGEANSTLEATTRQQFNSQSAQKGLAALGIGTTSHIGHDSNKLLTMSHESVPNLEGYSEILLTTMDWSRVSPTAAIDRTI